VTDHDRIDELLAGYVLRSLSGEDAQEADRLLTDHVPDCERCRATLASFQEAAADLALDAVPIRPPDTLLPRLHRELEPRGRRFGAMGTIAVAASVVAVIGLGGAIVQGWQADTTQSRLDQVNQIVDFIQTNDGTTAPVGQRMTEVSAPGVEEFYLYGDDVPNPPPGQWYCVWLAGEDSWKFVGSFVPNDGWVFMQIAFDPSRFDRLVVTIEPEGSVPPTPGEVAWQGPNKAAA
jgi:hypothetical protein